MTIDSVLYEGTYTLSGDQVIVESQWGSDTGAIAPAHAAHVAARMLLWDIVRRSQNREQRAGNDAC